MREAPDRGGGAVGPHADDLTIPRPLNEVVRPIHLHTDGLLEVYRPRSEEHTSELQSRLHLVCRLLLEKKKKNIKQKWCLLKNKREEYDSSANSDSTHM